MSFAVLLTKDAARDLNELYDYIAVHDSPRKADYVLEQIETTFSTLSEFPERGAHKIVQIYLCHYRLMKFSPPKPQEENAVGGPKRESNNSFHSETYCAGSGW
jgi:plasmid stabilization system protein ParE